MDTVTSSWPGGAPVRENEPGRWDCGAGAIEYGESFEKAVDREVREEYSTDILDLETIGVRNILRSDPSSHWIAIVFAVRLDPDSVRIGEPHKFDELGWFSPDSIPSPLHSQFSETLALFTKWQDSHQPRSQSGFQGDRHPL